jgi:hypothetical protein
MSNTTASFADAKARFAAAKAAKDAGQPTAPVIDVPSTPASVAAAATATATAIQEELAKRGITPEAASASTELAKPEETAVAPSSNSNELGGGYVPEDYKAREVIPSVVLVNGGNLSKEFTEGNFVFDKTVDLGRVLEATVVNFGFFYQEYIPYDDGDGPGRIFKSLKEVKEAKLCIPPMGTKAKDLVRGTHAVEIAVLRLAIKLTADKADFAHARLCDIDGNYYALANYWLRSGSLGIFRELMKYRTTVLKGGVHTFGFKIASVAKVAGKKTYFNPVMKLNGATNAKLITGLKAIQADANAAYAAPTEDNGGGDVPF